MFLKREGSTHGRAEITPTTLGDIVLHRDGGVGRYVVVRWKIDKVGQSLAASRHVWLGNESQKHDAIISKHEFCYIKKSIQSDR